MTRPQAFGQAVAQKLGTLRVRLTVWYVVLLALTLVAHGAILTFSLERWLYAGVDRVLADGARQAVGVLGLVRDDQELQEEFRRINVGTIVGVYDTSGTTLLAGRSLPRPLERVLPPVGSEAQIQTVSNREGASWRVLVQRAIVPDKPERVLLVARSSGFVQLTVGELALLVAVTTPLTLLLAIAGGVFLVQRALGPIEQITRTAEAINAEDLSQRLRLPRSPDEVGRLAVTFDQMLDRLDSAFEYQSQFTADASHELRTPLSMIVSRAATALERASTIAECHAALQEVRDEGLHMGRIVNDLLMLAKGDAGHALAVTERLDTGLLANSVVDAMQSLADDRAVALEAQVDDGIDVIGDQTRLTQLMVNLVDNALAHTPPGGRVLVGVRATRDTAVIEVIDTGTGIPAEVLPRVFERFFRGERDRDRSCPHGGAGLGLSLCLSIARAHGGDIDLESTPATGTRATVRLPLAPEARSRALARAEASPNAGGILVLSSIINRVSR